MAGGAHPSTGKLVGLIAIFVVLGIPLVAYLWELLSGLLSIQVTTGQALLGIPVALLFALLLVVLARQVERWHGGRAR